jgi:hypothetical protein
MHHEKQTATYFLRSRLFTYDIMKIFNCNIFLWFFKSKFRSYIGKQIKEITVCVPLKHFSDCEALQNDWDKLAQWEQQWGMQFHPSKCNSMSVTRSKTPFKFNYILKGHTLESVDTAKYLGIMHHLIQHDMECTHKQHNIKSTEIIRIF